MEGLGAVTTFASPPADTQRNSEGQEGQVWFTHRNLALLCMTLFLLFNVLAVLNTTYYIQKEQTSKPNAGDHYPIGYKLILNISRVAEIIHVITAICAILGVSVNSKDLLLPWLIYTWIQFAYYVILLVYAFAISKVIHGSLVLIYLVLLATIYYCCWIYYRQLQIAHSAAKPQVAAVNEDLQQQEGIKSEPM